MSAKTYIREDQEYYVDTDKPVWLHRYRQIRDGITGKPACDLRDEGSVVRLLEMLEKLERESRPD
jgi:hypothetical protein